MLFSVTDPTGAVPKSRVTVSVTTPEVACPAPRPQPAVAIVHAIAIAVSAALLVMDHLAILNSNFCPACSLTSHTPVLAGLPLTKSSQKSELGGFTPRIEVTSMSLRLEKYLPVHLPCV